MGMTTDEESNSQSCHRNVDATSQNKPETSSPCLQLETSQCSGGAPGSDCPETLSTGDANISPDLESACASGTDSQVETVTEDVEKIYFSVIYMKNKHDLICPSSETVAALKSRLETLLEVPAATQKLLYKGKISDEMTLGDWGLKNGSKVILMASKVQEIIDVQVPNPKALASSSGSGAPSTPKESLSKQKPHSKIIERGVPPEALPAYRNGRAHLPPEPLYGMLNKIGGKVRLTFKLEADQLWIGTKERTEKVSMSSVRAIISEPIEGHEEYHMMAIQLGPTEASRYWVYWVPAQYIQAIKDTILGSG